MAITSTTSSAQAPSTSPRPQARPAALPATQPAPAAPVADTVSLSQETVEEPVNPYQGLSEHSVSAAPDAWSARPTLAEGQVARNDCLEGMLRNQGYSLEDIYGADEQGRTMLDRVAEVNGLRNPNVIQAGQELRLPTRHQPEPAANPDADANSPEGVGPATAETNTGPVTNSEVNTVAVAEEGPATATTTTGPVTNSEVNTVAVAEEGPAVAYTGAESVDNSELTAVAVAPEGPAAALVENLDGTPGGTGVAVAAAQEDAEAGVDGFEDGVAIALSEEGTATARLGADTGLGIAEGVDATGTTEGLGTDAHFELRAEETARLTDDGLLGLPNVGTGNRQSVEGTFTDLQFQLPNLAGLDIKGQAEPGDNRISAVAPQYRDDHDGQLQAQGEDFRLDTDLGDGVDSVELGRGALDDTVILEKSEGELDLNLHFSPANETPGTSETLIDAGDALLSGRIGGSNGDDTTAIRGSNFGDLTIAGGAGNNDQLIIDLPEGAEIPSVLTQEGKDGFLGLGARDAQGILPEGYQNGDAAINAVGYENVLIRRNGEIVGRYGDAPVEASSFDEMLAAARS